MTKPTATVTPEPSIKRRDSMSAIKKKAIFPLACNILKLRWGCLIKPT